MWCWVFGCFIMCVGRWTHTWAMSCLVLLLFNMSTSSGESVCLCLNSVRSRSLCSAFAHSVTVSVGVWGCAARLPASANLSHICHTSKPPPLWLLLLRFTLFHKGSWNSCLKSMWWREWAKSSLMVWESFEQSWTFHYLMQAWHW